MYLAIDPGKGKKPSIGVARFSATGEATEVTQMTFDKFVDYLETLTEVKICIYEEYVIFRRMAQKHAGSRVETVQTIGVIKSWAHRNGVQLVPQKADILATAQKISQVFLPSNHAASHQWSAFNHGYWYLFNKGIVKSKLEIEEEKKRAGH